MKKILFATDGSDSSKESVKMLVELMNAWPTAEVEALYVTQIFTGRFSGPELTMDYERELFQSIQQELADELKPELLARVHFRHETAPKQPSIVICEVAEMDGADLIVIGSHGRSAADRLVLGSVSHGVLNRSHVPVFVIRK